MATIKTLIGNVKGKDGGGYEEVVLYDGNCSACINSNNIKSNSAMMELSDSIENYKSIRIEYLTYDGRGEGAGLIYNLPIVVSVDYIKTTYGYNAITTGVTGSNSSNFSFGFYNDKHLAQTWASYGSLAHNMSYIKVIGIRDKVSDAEKNFNKYSTTEEVVGTWIDGKPLYRKSFNYTATTGEVIVADLSSLNIDTACHMYGNFKDGNALIESIPFYLHSAYTVAPFYKLADKSLRLTANIANLTGTGVVTIEYTKTTD